MLISMSWGFWSHFHGRLTTAAVVNEVVQHHIPISHPFNMGQRTELCCVYIKVQLYIHVYLAMVILTSQSHWSTWFTIFVLLCWVGIGDETTCTFSMVMCCNLIGCHHNYSYYDYKVMCQVIYLAWWQWPVTKCRFYSCTFNCCLLVMSCTCALY